MHDDDITPKERDAFAGLPREFVPGPDLEERVVGALQRRRLLRRRPRRAIELSGGRIAVAIAASLAFVIGGFALGQWTTLDRIMSTQTVMLGSTQMSAASSVQQAATAYLLALEDLSALPDTANVDELQQGREVAMSTLYAAAGRVSRMVPKEYLAGQLLSAIDVTPEDGDSPPRIDAERASKYIWF